MCEEGIQLGIWHQLRKKKTEYSSGGRITLRHIKLATMYIYGLCSIYGTIDDENIHEEEELDIALKHWKFLYKYNLI